MSSLRIQGASHQTARLCQVQHPLTSPQFPLHFPISCFRLHWTRAQGNEKSIRKSPTAAETCAHRDFPHLPHGTPPRSAPKNAGTNNNCCKLQPSHLPLGSLLHCLYPGSPLSALPVARAISPPVSLTRGAHDLMRREEEGSVSLSQFTPLPSGPFAPWERCVLDLARRCEKLSHVCWWKV